MSSFKIDKDQVYAIQTPSASQQTAARIKRDWRYVRTAKGERQLLEGKGISPGFLKLLGAVSATTPLGSLGMVVGQLDAEDLELWLAELQRMGLIRVWQEEAAPSTGGVSGTHASMAATPERVRVLLIDQDPLERDRWRRLLTGLPLDMSEAATLEEVNREINSAKPTAILLGSGADFDSALLLTVLKRPHRRKMTCFLMTNAVQSAMMEPATAALADVLLDAEDGDAVATQFAAQMHLVLPPSRTLKSAWGEILYGEGEHYSDAAGGAQRSAPPGARALRETGEFPTVARRINLRAALEEHHPRVLVQLTDLWVRVKPEEFRRDGADALGNFLNDLIIDDRGDRAGFLPEVMDELLFLNRLYREIVPVNDVHHFHGAGYEAHEKADTKRSAFGELFGNRRVGPSSTGRWSLLGT